MTPYDFINILLTNPTKYKTLTLKEKESYFFMVNRVLAIDNWIQAHKFNKNANPKGAVDSWFYIYRKKDFKYTPKWVYTKFSSIHAKVDDILSKFDKEILREFCVQEGLDFRDLNELLMFNSEEVLKRLKNIEKRNKEKINGNCE